VNLLEHKELAERLMARADRVRFGPSVEAQEMKTACEAKALFHATMFAGAAQASAAEAAHAIAAALRDVGAVLGQFVDATEGDTPPRIVVTK
jgi:hypothetical protein